MSRIWGRSLAALRIGTSHLKPRGALGRSGRPGLALAIALGASGCAGRPEGVLVPVAVASPGASTVEMLVATTRQPTTQPGVMFSGERGALAFADIAVSIPPDSTREIGQVQWPSELPGNPATDFVALRAQDIDQARAVDWTHRALARVPKRRVLLFVHGFNNKFDESVFRYAQIIHDSRAPVVPVLFTWPSRGSVLAYGYDHDSANYSRDALESVLQTLARDPKVGEISILAHSMGNWLTLESLRQMAIRNGRIAPKIKNLMLAAPDVDVDVFKRQLADIGPNDAHVTLFVSQDDRALAVSARVWGGAPRLGAINPQTEPTRSDLSAGKISVVDLTSFKDGGDTNHAKFAESADVVSLIGQRLVEGQTITESRGGVSDRIIEATTNAATVVGSAAGLVLATPAIIVDPNSRASYGEHVQTVGTALVDTAQAGIRILPAAGP